MKRILCLLCALLLALPACALGENVQDSLILGIYSTRTVEIRPLNPQERDMMSIYAEVYESMVTIDDDGLPQPLLAETWTNSSNGGTWTFTLRENLVFSDGTPLTAADVAASGQYLLAQANDETTSNFYATLKYMVKSITAKDDRTVEVKAARPYYGLLYAMTFPVVPAAQVEQAMPLGSGPYVITTFQPGGYLLLDANPNWWQTQPQVTQITVTLFASNKELITAYEYGRVDTAFTRSVAASQYKSGNTSLSVTYATRQLETLLLNHSSRAYPLDNTEIRRAVRLAIDPNLISTSVYMGMTTDADTPIASSSWLYYDGQESAFQYNRERAEQILAEQGWSDSDNDGVLDKIENGEPKKLVLGLLVYEDPENDVRFETANMIADMLAAVKISVHVDTTTYEQEKASLEAGSFDMALASFQMDVVPDSGFFLISGNKQNYCRYRSDEMTSLFNTLRTNVGREDFAYTTQAIQQQFERDVPFVCLFYRAGAILTRKMYTTVRSIREFELLRGIEAFGR